MENDSGRDGIGGNVGGATNPDGKLEPYWVPPDKIADVWPHIEARVLEAKSNARDVFGALEGGTAHLLVVLGEGVEAFAVLTLIKSEDATLSLHIWTYWAGQKAHSLDGWLPILERYARDLGAKFITFSSKRRGWLRRAESLGFTIEEVRYRRTV